MERNIFALFEAVYLFYLLLPSVPCYRQRFGGYNSCDPKLIQNS